MYHSYVCCIDTDTATHTVTVAEKTICPISHDARTQYLLIPYSYKVRSESGAATHLSMAVYNYHERSLKYDRLPVCVCVRA